MLLPMYSGCRIRRLYGWDIGRLCGWDVSLRRGGVVRRCLGKIVEMGQVPHLLLSRGLEHRLDEL